jgi:hypothetical protein
MGSQKLGDNVTIAVLSWGANETLFNSLHSYSLFNLGVGEQKIVLLQEGTEAQEAICRSFGYTPFSIPQNIGIARGYEYLLNLADEKYFLFLENDWELIADPEPSIMLGIYMLQQSATDIVRYRHRTNPGEPLWSRQFAGREYDRPEYLLDSLHWVDDPAKFPDISHQSFKYQQYNMDYNSMDPVVQEKKMEFFCTTAPYANWTNNPHMALTDFLRREIMPRLGTGDLEKDIQAWWQQQPFKVCQSDGLFTHNRLDR